MANFYYNDVLLPEIPQDVLAEYPHCIIVLTNSTYKLTTSQCKWFKTSADKLQVKKCTNVEFTYNGVDWGTGVYYEGIGNWSVNTLIWSSHDIPNGGETATDIYFYGSNPVPEGGSVEPDEPDVPIRTSGYLIQSGDSLFTVTDGVLTTVEGSVNAELFRTYGVDDIPSSDLLVTLTDPVVLYWVDTTEYEITPLVAMVQGVPFTQTIESKDYYMTNDSILGIEKVLVDASDDVRFAISFNSGLAWKMHTGEAWATLTESDTGMSASVMSAITTEDWNSEAITGKFRFRITIPSSESYLNSLIVDYLN